MTGEEKKYHKKEIAAQDLLRNANQKNSACFWSQGSNKLSKTTDDLMDIKPSDSLDDLLLKSTVPARRR